MSGNSIDVKITFTCGWICKRRVTYVGSCTVWHEAGTGKRASTGLEEWLSSHWARLGKPRRGHFLIA